MMLAMLLIIPLISAFACWAIARRSGSAARWIALACMIAEMIMTTIIFAGHFAISGGWLLELKLPWLPQLGISFHLAADGMSLLLIMLTAILGSMAIVASWTGIKENIGFFHFNLLLTLFGVIGVFVTIDLFLFYFFWELMLVPMFFLILSWGHGRRFYAAVKFFIFTQLGGLFMLVSIVGLAFAHRHITGTLSFDYMDLLGTRLHGMPATIFLLGFLAAFLVKLPAMPVHVWLADAHTQAPTGGSIILAGILLKTGAYGLIRFALPLFPDAALELAPYGMVLAVAGIIYGAIISFAQTDIKRLIAYTSISHMGFVLLGICAGSVIALQGAVIQIVCHGLGTGGLFMLAGALEQRIGTRELSRMGGLWSKVPCMGGIWLVFALAALGLPGLGNFLGEFLVLLGSWRSSITATVIAASGFVFATLYALWMLRQVFFGTPRTAGDIPDLKVWEIVPLAAAIGLLVWIGLFPQSIITASAQGLNNLKLTMDHGLYPGHAIKPKPFVNVPRGPHGNR